MSNEEFHINNNPNAFFDIKGLLIKMSSYWYVFVLSILIALGIAHRHNIRKQSIYGMETLISIKDDQNPFFTTNTSLTFNWGGTTDKVNTAIVQLQSRTHHEKVVEKIEFYKQYLRQGKYDLIDIYGKTPFLVEHKADEFQALNTLFKINIVDDEHFEFNIENINGGFTGQNYKTKATKRLSYDAESFNKRYRFGEPIDEVFFKGTVLKTFESVPKGAYFFRFLSFHAVVNSFKSMNVNPKTSGSSVLSLSLSGTNKAKLVDYLNTCVEVLSEDQLERKNLFATRTIEFIDKNLQDKADELKQIEEQLKEFRQKNPTFINAENSSINERLTALEIQKRAEEQKLDYYNTLESYLKSDKNDYSGVQAPSVVGIDEANIVQNVAKILELSERRKRFEYSAREGTLILKEVDRDIQSVKDVLFENIISSRQLLNKEINRINAEMYRVNQQFVSLPQEQQDMLNIQRQYNINERLYNNFLAKRSEAGIVKAANVSDVMVIDEAKDTGGGRIGPQTQINYIIALMFGFFIPFTLLFLITFFDTKIDNPQMLERITSIPLIAVISKYSRAKNNLVVFEHPQEPISEAFRGLRSSLYFNFRKQNIEGAKTILVTSSIPGEGKTFTSINVATVLALGNKKTLLVGFDMRKPKIFDDFDLDNSVGVVDYLVDKAPLTEVVRKTKVPNLDIITSGMVPRNPSELLMSESLEEFIEEIKQEYEFIVFDTPPVTLVTDASELFRFCDVSLYVVRQAYTPKAVLQHINEQYQKGQTGTIFTLFNYYKKSRRYGYGYGYGYNYSYGYGKAKSRTSKNIFKRLKKAFKIWKA